MLKKAVGSVITILLAFFLAQSLVYSAPMNPVDTSILFTPSDLVVSPDHETLYLADGSNKCLVAADLKTGQTQTLALPNTPTRIVYAGAKIYVALSTPDYGSDSVAVVDLTTFTVVSTISVDLDISGLAADANYLYAYSSSKIESFNASGTKLSTLTISNLYDLKVNPSDGNLYGVTNASAVCLGAAGGQLSLLKTNSSYSGNRVTLLPDGHNFILNSGVVLSCSSDSSKTLNFKIKLQSSNTMCTDEPDNELYLVSDQLIQVYDVSTFAAKRVLAQTKVTDYLLFSSGKLIIAQKDSTNNLVFRAIDPGALLSSLKFNSDVISELYPLQFSVDGGTVSNSTASLDISAVPAIAGAEVSGNIGTVPLTVGKNTLSIMVKNTATENMQTYTVAITRAAKDFPAPTYNAFTNLGFVPMDFVMDPDRQAAYLTASGGYSLFRVDLASGMITEKQFTLPAERLVLKNGNIYVTLLRTGHTYNGTAYGYGAVAVVDADTFATKAIFNTDIDPYDIEVDDAGYVYLAPGANQWSALASYDGNAGVFVSSTSNYYKNFIERNPVSGKLYSSDGFTAFEISNGVFTKSYRCSGNYSTGSCFKVSPDGKYIFCGSGSIFTSAPTQTGDMVFNGTLGSSYSSICFNLADQEFYTANGKTLTAYNYVTRTVKNTYTLADTIVGMSYGAGKFTLLQKSTSQQYYVRTLAIGSHAVDLASIGVSAGTLSPAFDANRLSYSLVLPASTTSVTVSPTTLDSEATFTIDGNAVASKTITLDRGNTASVMIAVQSRDKALVQTYTMFIYRQTDDRTMLISTAFFTPTQQISAGGALYLAAKDQPFLYKFDGASGTFSALPLPGVPNALGCAGNAVFAAMEDTRTNSFSIGVIDMGTFALTDTFAVDTCFTGIRGDDDTIYAFTSSAIKGYARLNHQLAFTKAISSIVDVQADPADGMVYVATSYISSYCVKNGQLTLIKTNSNCPGQAFAVMPDGMHLVLPSGAVLRCSSNPAYDLMPETVTMPSLGSVAADAATNELYAVDSNHNYPNNFDSYLIGVYDASDFSFKRTIPDPTPMQSILASSGCLYVARKDSQGNVVLRSSYSDAMLQAVTVDGDIKDGLYPLLSAVDVGEVPASATSVDLGAAAGPGSVVTGDIGHRTLAAGRNTFALTVTSSANGHTQTYSVTLTRRSSDPAASDARTNLGFTPLDVALDPDRPVEYMTVSNCKSLYRVDLQTGQITEKTFSVPVERLSIKDGYLYVTLLRSGHNLFSTDNGFAGVAVINTDSFQTERVLNTDIDPYDIEVDDNGVVYLVPGSNQTSILVSYNGKTNELLSKFGTSYTFVYLDRNPVTGKLYFITTNISPRDITAIEVSQGKITKSYDSPYHGDYAMATYERVSPDGSLIFNGAGTMFACKAVQTGDMNYLGTLGKPFTSICFDLPDDRFYTAKDNTLTVYVYSTKTALNTLTFADSFVNLQYDGSKIIAVQKNSTGYFYTHEIPAVATVNQYTVSFNAEGGTASPTSINVTYGSAYGTLPSPIRTGYAFDGWYTAENGGGTRIMSASIVNITAEQYLYANWIANTYKVTLDPQGGAVSPTSVNVTYTGAYGTLPAPARTGYTFDNWYTVKNGGGSKITSASYVSITADQTLYANWTANTYTVALDPQGGTVSPTSVNVTYASAYGTLPAPIRTGYTFYGWYTAINGDGTKITSASAVSITADQTLYANWTANTYTVTLNPEGGTVSPSSVNVTYASAYGTLPSPARAGYTFSGWYTAVNGGAIKITSASVVNITADQTLYANWAANTYTVTLDPEGGTVSPSSVTVSNGEAYGTLPMPIKDGYTFDGWYTAENGDGTKITSACIVNITADQTLYANWTANTYTVTLDPQGGTVSPSSVIVTYASAYGTLPSPARAGYKFSGWYTTVHGGGTKITSASVVSITAPQTLYANWMVNTYKVTLDPQGSTVNPTSISVTYRSSCGTLPTPAARTGYAFGGWYTGINGTGTQFTSSTPVTANITVYAKWTTNKYAISAAPNNTTYGSVTGAGSYAYGTTATLRAIPKAEYRFVRWLEGTVAVSTSADYSFIVTKGRTLTAEFAEIGTPVLKAVSGSYDSVRLTWTAVGGAAAYEVYRASSASGTYALVRTVTGLSFTNTGLTTGTTYYYKVRAKCFAGRTTTCGGFSSIQSVRPIPASPTNVLAVRVSATSIKIGWNTVACATMYEVYRTATGGGTYSLVATTSSLSWTNTGLTKGKTYWYKVRTYHLEGATKVYGPFSMVVSATP